MNRLAGLETEYGIQVDDVEKMDVVVESMELIRCFLHEEFVARWDYARENPRQDMRGFEVDELLNDVDETVHLQRDRKRQIPLKELKSDLIIRNGARLYNDHTHPEYSTPECLSLIDLATYDRAGEQILLGCAKQRTATRDSGVVRLYKNNTDFEGHSYGCHENYLIGREIPFQQVIDGLLPFVVTRPIFAGAGKVGVENDTADSLPPYQLSQRADFFETIASVDTMHRRPLVNTRDEPHANRVRYRRLHMITGDANMSEYITALKVGTMALVLEMLEAGILPAHDLADPIGAHKEISRDLSGAWVVQLTNRSHTTALKIQDDLRQAALSHYGGRDDETDWVLAQWRQVLDDLGTDRSRLVGRCDWVTKKWLLDAFVEAEKLDWGNPDHQAWLQSQDLEYHNIDPAEGLFLMLEQQGEIVRLTEESGILKATVEPPAGTRAYFRGVCLARFGEKITALNWDSIEFALEGGSWVLDLKDCVDAETAAYYNETLDKVDSVEALRSKLDRAD
jgi:proteasome accessory factor PafA2